MFTSVEMRARYQQTTDVGREEAAVISLLWENKRLIDFVMLSSSVSEYSCWITLQQKTDPTQCTPRCNVKASDQTLTLTYRLLLCSAHCNMIYVLKPANS